VNNGGRVGAERCGMRKRKGGNSPQPRTRLIGSGNSGAMAMAAVLSGRTWGGKMMGDAATRGAVRNRGARRSALATRSVSRPHTRSGRNCPGEPGPNGQAGHTAAWARPRTPFPLNQMIFQYFQMTPNFEIQNEEFLMSKNIQTFHEA
jgi:hypothetical protein